jgi:hypothetical protein
VDPSIGKAGLRLGLFIVVLATGMLIFLKPGTPEFVITVFTLLIGLLFIGIIVALVRLLPR